VADFGISKQLEQTFGVAKSFVGTATYMAPERVRGAEYSTSSDVWSLGMIALECAQVNLSIYLYIYLYIYIYTNIILYTSIRPVRTSGALE